MNKHITLLGAAVALIMVTTSCSKDTEDQTWLTYYPSITLEGDTYSMAPMGQPYDEPGYSASSAGEDVTAEVQLNAVDVVTGEPMDLQNPAPGYYRLVYSVSNDYGNSIAESRYVIVYDPDDAASGYYYSSPQSYRDYNGITYYGGSYMIVVAGYGEGQYYCSDLLGGWYAQRSNYGSAYDMTGEISIAPDGAITLLDSYIAGWGDGLDELTNGTFDSATSTITYDVMYAGMLSFHVIMSK